MSEQMRVLVVEDEELVGTLVRINLEGEGYEVIDAELARTAKARAVLRGRQFVNSDDPDDTVFYIEQRGQRRPAPGPYRPPERMQQCRTSVVPARLSPGRSRPP